MSYAERVAIPERNTAQEYWISADSTNMRKGRDSLASVVRQKSGKNPKMGMRAYIFYAKNLKTIKILHYTVTGYEMYVKWFDDGRALRPEFSKMKSTHTITRSQLLLLLNGAVKRTLKIN